MAFSKKLFPLEGKIQHYAWGGYEYIPRLLGVNNPAHQPFAEYWLGAHDQASSEIITGETSSEKLNEYIQLHPVESLGAYANKRFGRLPYLLKVLDVKDMLSIQVHPSKANAEKEFASENKKGIDLSAANRNYKDDNHKPEMMVALSDFWLLHGFKEPAALTAILEKKAQLNFLKPVFEKGGYRELYRAVMEMPQKEVNRVLTPLIDKIVAAYQNNQLSESEEDFWAARAAITFNHKEKIDRGIFSIYFFNLLQLKPGEAIFQDAGLPHAYLEGQNIELMANSDNVLRGGLTPKHVDPVELMKHIEFSPTHPRIIYGEKKADQTGLEIFPQPAPEFELRKIQLKKGKKLRLSSMSAEVFLVLTGSIRVEEKNGDGFERKQGSSFIAFDQSEFELSATEDAVLFVAGVPSTHPNSL